MEEAEVLCDRLGIFVDGSLQCIGNPKEVLELLTFHFLNTNSSHSPLHLLELLESFLQSILFDIRSLS